MIKAQVFPAAAEPHGVKLPHAPQKVYVLWSKDLMGLYRDYINSYAVPPHKSISGRPRRLMLLVKRVILWNQLPFMT